MFNLLNCDIIKNNNDNSINTLNEKININTNISSNINNEVKNDDNLNDILINDLNTISNNDIKKLIDRLDETEKIEIFKIINFHNEKYSVNNNGIFFNLVKVKDETKNDIIKLLNFSSKNKLKLFQEEQKINSLKEIINDT